jgi:hypothetical protein
MELKNRIDWVDLAQGRENWQSVVNTVMNRRGFLPQLRDFLKINSAPGC